MQSEAEIKYRVVTLMNIWGVDTENEFNVKLAIAMYQNGQLDEKFRKYFEDGEKH
jgi:hypothetical protein